ncbi:hypothetical protein V2J09_006422 [Rumex salicifolius]
MKEVSVLNTFKYREGVVYVPGRVGGGEREDTADGDGVSVEAGFDDVGMDFLEESKTLKDF